MGWGLGKDLRVNGMESCEVDVVSDMGRDERVGAERGGGKTHV